MGLVYREITSGSKVLNDSYPAVEIQDGMLLEVKAKWIIKVPDSAYTLYKDYVEGVDDPAKKKINIVREFKLEPQLPLGKKKLQDHLQVYRKCVAGMLDRNKRDEFHKGFDGVVKFLLHKRKELLLFSTAMGQSLLRIFAYYQDGDPVFLYFSHALKASHEPPSDTTFTDLLGAMVQNGFHTLASASVDRNVLGPKCLYIDALSGDNILSDSFPANKLGEDVMLLEVEGKRIVLKVDDKKVMPIDDTFGFEWVASKEDYEGIDSDFDDISDFDDNSDFDVRHYTMGSEWVVLDTDENKVIDVIDTFGLKEIKPYDEQQFLEFIKVYSIRLADKLKRNRNEFWKSIQGTIKFLLPKLKDLQFFTGPSMKGTLIFAYYKDDASDPTFLYFSPGLKALKYMGDVGFKGLKYSPPKEVQLQVVSEEEVFKLENYV